MATGGVELDVSSVDADDAVSGNFGVPCDPCGKKMKTTPAVSFCKTHKEYLCDYCCDLHKHYSELDSFGSSTVPGHLRINIFVFP